ncbi:hypothetical protein PHYSODRAFT_319422 [Phytophthora sojae]|uniref:Temptin Cys/Cys disulfide domain-containing protein n=1 Tax=Phytophthora sojae (strain P6497) TaxID=1094619 RepID=G5AAV0_PHYSP|nr:hypothetical protein PHYSODRAFT_319422 [Phytophthora sojae]EGZ07729.1 hypothetical protein PHYSODRAFT_319422 [Phytophthora sojae]|eukprot:XP_009537295.1 hypothetical protein PHYSODRAFT_319422 [Phytophthora sojae]
MKTYATLAASALIVAATMNSATAMKSYLEDLPNGSLFTQELGHPGMDSSKFTEFATAFGAVDHTWSADFCGKTFPGASMTNGEAFGDPCCTWTKGGKPDFTVSPFTTKPTKATTCASGGKTGAGGSAAAPSAAGSSAETPSTGSSAETPSTGLSAETPSTEQGSGAETPSTEESSGAETPSTEQGSGAETPSTEESSGAEMPSTEQGSGAETPSTEQGSGAETPSAETPSTGGGGWTPPATGGGCAAKGARKFRH